MTAPAKIRIWRMDAARCVASSMTRRPEYHLNAGSKPLRAFAVVSDTLTAADKLQLFAAALGAPCGQRSERIVGPGMPRITPAHFGFDLRVAAAPEAGQIARHLHRTLGGRQKFDQQRHASAGDRRMPGKAEQFLHPDRKLRAFLGFVI